MKYGLFCPVCDRLLWKGPAKLSTIDEMVPKKWRHASQGHFYSTGTPLYWCGCKPTRPPQQQDLAEPQ